MSAFKKPSSVSSQRFGGDLGNKTLLPGKMKKEQESTKSKPIKAAAANNSLLKFQSQSHNDLLTINAKTNNYCSTPVGPAAALTRFRPPAPTFGLRPPPIKKPLLDRFGKALVHQPFLKPKQPPKKIPQDPTTLARLKYSSCLRATLILNNAKKEKQLAIGGKVQHTLDGIVDIARKRQNRLFVLRLCNEEILKFKCDIQNMDFIQGLFKAVDELTDKTDTVETLKSMISVRLDTLPVRNCRVNEPVAISALKTTVMQLNREICSKHGTSNVAVRTGENLAISSNAHETSKELQKALEKLNNKLAIMMSMKVHEGATPEPECSYVTSNESSSE